MSETEFTLGGHTYRVSRLNAKQQFDVGRRLAYVIAQLTLDNKGDQFKPTAENFARIILLWTGGVPQADMDAALNIALGAVLRRMPGDRGWAPITQKQTGDMMFDDIDMPAMLEILWHVIAAHRMPDFLSVSGHSSAAPKTSG